MPLEDHKQAMKDGLISKKQYEKLPPHLLTAIIKSKKKQPKKVPKGSHKMPDGSIMKDKDMKKKKKK